MNVWISVPAALSVRHSFVGEADGAELAVFVVVTVLVVQEQAMLVPRESKI